MLVCKLYNAVLSFTTIYKAQVFFMQKIILQNFVFIAKLRATLWKFIAI